MAYIMKYYKMRKILKRFNWDYDFYKGRLNVVIPFRYDKLRHWLAKCIVSKVLEDLGFRFLTEHEINDKLVDAFCLDNLTAYEIESSEKKNYEEKVKERINKKYEYHADFSEIKLVVFNLKELPKDYDKLYNYFLNYFNIELKKLESV